MNENPFRAMNLDEDIEKRKKEKGEVVTVWLSPQDRLNLEEWKKLIQQEKDGTAFKQLAYIGAKLLGSQEIKATLEVVLNNYRKNKRMGVVTFD